jgi:polyhydroxybutyrate depolymerase
VLPPDTKPRSEIGAIFFFHGFTGSALETLSDKSLVEIAQKQGVALVALDGLGGRWSIPGVSDPQRDEIKYVEQVLDDAVRRFNLNPKRLMASGFSLGGSMVWYLACSNPERFAAFAPIAGAFWEPIPESCAGTRPPIMHFHGLSDTTVPIAGRLVRSGRHLQKSRAH